MAKKELHKPLHDRFVEKLTACAGYPEVGKCWEWPSGTSKAGYGMIHIGNRLMAYAHRKAWELFNGKIPDGLHVLHKCDNRKCVNALDHMFLGRHADNMRDMKEKNRHQFGEKSVSSKLKESDVRSIRSAYARGIGGQTDLGRKYGVCQSAIRRIVLGLSWRHVS